MKKQSNQSLNIFFAAVPKLAAAKQIYQSFTTLTPPFEGIKWVVADDLHLTLGYIPNFQLEHLDSLVPSFDELDNLSPLEITFSEIRLFGNAICLIAEPAQALEQQHLQLTKLLEAYNQKHAVGPYQFKLHDRFVPHITIGRLKNNSKLSKQNIATLEQVTDNLRLRLKLSQISLLTRLHPNQAYFHLHNWPI